MANGPAVIAEQQGNVAGAFAARRARPGGDLQPALSGPRLHGGAQLHRPAVAGAVRGLGADPGPGSVAATAAALTGLPEEPGPGQPDLPGRRPGAQDRAGLYRAGGPGGHGDQQAGEADLAAGRGHGARPVSAHGAGPCSGRAGRPREHPRLGIPSRLAVDPVPARLDRRHGRETARRPRGRPDCPTPSRSRLVEYVRHPAAVPVGFWRSVGHSINAFAVESALDEMALGARRRPAGAPAEPAGRRPAQPQCPEHRRRARRLGNSASGGHARGLAFSAAFGSITAQVAEISQPAAGTIRSTASPAPSTAARRSTRTRSWRRWRAAFTTA